MNPRERILAISAFAVTGLLLVAFIATKVILGPTDEYRSQAVAIAIEVEKLESKNRREGFYRETLVDSTKRSYGDDPSTAAEMSRAHLVKLVAKAGLAGESLSMIPVTGRNVKGGREVGWTVRVKGTQDKLTNFLYVVGADPHLHKLDGVIWTPNAGSNELTLQARFATLVLDAVEPPAPRVPRDTMERIAQMMAKPLALLAKPAQSAAPLENTVKIDSPERRWYGLISDRDIFRPYIKRPPVIVRQPDPPSKGPTRSSDPPPPPPTPTATYQLVGLPTWNDEPEVVVKDTRSLKSTTYKIGQDLIGGEIVMVDYRPLPLPKKPLIISTSRVIVRVDRDYWAVELGQFLTDKYVLTGDRLPDSLRRSQQPASAPATPPASPLDRSTSDSSSTGAARPTGSEAVSQETDHVP